MRHVRFFLLFCLALVVQSCANSTAGREHLIRESNYVCSAVSDGQFVRADGKGAFFSRAYSIPTSTVAKIRALSDHSRQRADTMKGQSISAKGALDQVPPRYFLKLAGTKPGHHSKETMDLVADVRTLDYPYESSAGAWVELGEKGWEEMEFRNEPERVLIRVSKPVELEELGHAIAYRSIQYFGGPTLEDLLLIGFVPQGPTDAQGYYVKETLPLK